MIVGAAHRIAMFVLAEHVLALVLGRVIVHGDEHRLIRRHPRQDASASLCSNAQSDQRRRRNTR